MISFCCLFNFTPPRGSLTLSMIAFAIFDISFILSFFQTLHISMIYKIPHNKGVLCPPRFLSPSLKSEDWVVVCIHIHRVVYCEMWDEQHTINTNKQKLFKETSIIQNKYESVRTLHVCGHNEFIAEFSNAGDNIAAAVELCCSPLNTQALTKDQLTLKLSLLFPAWTGEQ